MSSDAENPQHRPPAFFMSLTSVAAALLVVSGMLVLYGWHADFEPLTNVLPQISALKANTGAGFILAGMALWLQRAARPAKSMLQKLQFVLALLLALAVILLGALTLVQDLLNVDFQIDQLLFTAPPLNGDLHPGRMSPFVALGFLLAGTALLLLDHATRGGHHAAEYCALTVVGIMGIPLIGYLYAITGILHPDYFPGVAPHIPLLFIVLVIGIMSARPAHRLMTLLNSEAPGGHLLRRLLPQSLLLLVMFNLLVEWGARRGLYGPESISPLLVLLAGGWLSILFWRAASLLNREYDVRRKGEAALGESNALLNVVSDNTPDAIFVKDRNGRMIFANPATLRMLDKSAANVIGHVSSEIYADAADAQMVDANDQQVVSSGRAQMMEETLHYPYGARTFYSTRAPWINDHGDVIGVVGISTDITDRKRIEDALKAHETQLEVLVAARTAEVSELMAHLESTREEEKRAIARELHDDLGSALTALNMHLAILFQKMPAQPDLTERSVQIKALLSSVTQTTRRIQIGLRPDKLDIFGIKIAIAEQALEFETYTGVTCHASLPDEELSYTPQMDIALFRLVQEALNNIAKHAKATRVDVVLDDNDDEIMLSIRDNGVGMPSLPDGSRITHGLRGMRERASYLGGEIRITSAPGNGTSIVVRLPKLPLDASGVVREKGIDLEN